MAGLGPCSTGGPRGDWIPPVAGLAGVISSDGKIHDGKRAGQAVLSTFSGSALTVKLGGSSRRVFAERAACISDLSRVFNISV